MSKRSNTYVILGVTLALLLALTGSLLPSSVEASNSGMGKHHSGHGYHASHGRYYSMGNAHFQPPKPPRKIVREEFAPDECVWWGYVRKGGGYARFHKPCRHGNQTQDYSKDFRSLFDPVAPIAGTMTAEEEEGAVEAVVAEEAPVEAEESAGAETEEAATVEESPAEEEIVAEEVPVEEETVAEEVPAEEEMAAEEIPAAEEMAEAEGPEDIVDTVVASEGLATFVEVVEAAGLVDSLKGEGPFTVFAPIDEAFDNLPDDLLDTLLADDSGELNQVLLRHVVPGIILSDEISDGMEAETLGGDSVTFSVDGESVTVDDALLIAADIETSNGVIHVIDAVLLAPSE